MGRKNACGVNEGTCVLLMRLIRLDELPGRSGFEFPVDNRAAGGGPRRDCGGWADVAAREDIDRSPSSEAMSVMREEIPPMEGGRGTSNPGDTGKPGVTGVDAVLESAMAGCRVSQRNISPTIRMRSDRS